MQLTKNFTLEELLRSGSAQRSGFKEQFTPSPEVIANLTALAVHVLQPLRDYLGQSIFVSSGYRCERLNKAIGGAKTSQHLTGEAADIQATGTMENLKLVEALKRAKISWDQCIIEFVQPDGQPAWIHVSYSSQRRGEILEAYTENGITKYRAWKRK